MRTSGGRRPSGEKRVMRTVQREMNPRTAKVITHQGYRGRPARVTHSILGGKAGERVRPR